MYLANPPSGLMPPSWYATQLAQGRIDSDLADERARLYGWPSAHSLLRALAMQTAKPSHALSAMQEALEDSEQRRWRHMLEARIGASRAVTSTPSLQAVFCMDVRAEAFRRALEAVDASISTLGYAGSFGLHHDHLHRALDKEEATRLALQALRGMSLTSGFAPTVMLVGHGIKTGAHAHLPHLQCGACQGRSGEAYARKMAEMLNTDSVRHALVARGVLIPSNTRFVAALHDTATDRLHVYPDRGALSPATQAWLQQAEQTAPMLRGPKRPEWGLAGNAALIIAPRALTRQLDLQGRAFLHEYRPELDADGQVLEGILTTALPIAQGINRQYNEAVLAQLPAMRNGQDWVHTPQRLAVWIDTPSARIDQLLARHPSLQHLVEGRELYLNTITAQPHGALCDATA